MDVTAADDASGSPRCAVTFRTHSWNAFAARRLRQRVCGGDSVAVVDETGGAVEGIEYDRVVRVTAAELTKFGLPHTFRCFTILRHCPTLGCISKPT